MFRAMRNDHTYKLGRGMIDAHGKSVLDSRSRRALVKKTSYGKRLETASWVRHEYHALEELHAAGADVPVPIACSENAILMEFVGDEDGAAPILHSVSLDRTEAEALLKRLIRNVEIMLGTYRIHADLSAYNVLYRNGEVRIIDFPQTVDAIRHPDAFRLFARDIDRLCRYFARQGVETDPTGLTLDLWTHLM
jgi:RIO kinase 1